VWFEIIERIVRRDIHARPVLAGGGFKTWRMATETGAPSRQVYVTSEAVRRPDLLPQRPAAHFGDPASRVDDYKKNQRAPCQRSTTAAAAPSRGSCRVGAACEDHALRGEFAGSIDRDGTMAGLRSRHDYTRRRAGLSVPLIGTAARAGRCQHAIGRGRRARRRWRSHRVFCFPRTVRASCAPLASRGLELATQRQQQAYEF